MFAHEENWRDQIIDGRFRVDRIIDRGGMGTVFKGTQLSMDRAVAIKVLHRALDNEHYRRFQREAKVMAALGSHANIVQIIDFGSVNELPYLVMEYIDGPALSSLLARGRLPLPAAIDCMLGVLDGLSEAHLQGIIHRDLKPGNILLRPAPGGHHQAKIADFGIARVADDQTNLTLEGKIVGTPGYLAPEQAKSNQSSPLSDLYPCGIMLYEMLTGSRAFIGTSNVDILIQQTHNPSPSLAGHAKQLALPNELVRLVDAMSAMNPSDRPQSAIEARRVLHSIRAQLHEHIVPVQPVETQTEEAPGLAERLASNERRGGGWDVLMDGTLGGDEQVIDPQAYDVNPVELDVSFEFGVFDSPNDAETVEKAAHRVERPNPIRVRGGDMGNLELAEVSPTRVKAAPRSTRRTTDLRSQSGLLRYVLLATISFGIIAAGFWFIVLKRRERFTPPVQLSDIAPPESTKPAKKKKKKKKKSKDGEWKKPIDL